MQYQPAGPPAGPPLYAPTPLLQPAHPTPFYIDDILGSRGAPAPPPPPPSLPSPNSSFTSLAAASSYRSPVYEPTPLHPAFSHHLAAAYGAGAYGAPAGGPLYPFPRAVADYSHALLRHHDHLGKHRRTGGGGRARKGPPSGTPLGKLGTGRPRALSLSPPPSGGKRRALAGSATLWGRCEAEGAPPEGSPGPGGDRGPRRGISSGAPIGTGRERRSEQGWVGRGRTNPGLERFSGCSPQAC